MIYRAQTSGLDLEQTAQADRLRSLVEFYGVSAEDGALKLQTTSEEIGDDLFTFAQTCLETTWLSKMNRLVRRTSTKAQFNKKLSSILTGAISEERIAVRWFDEASDPDKLYPVDYRIEGRDKQLFLFGVSSQVHCTEATISCLHHKNAGADFIGVVVYEEETNIRRKHADRLNDVVDRRFARIGESQTIAQYLARVAA